MQLHSLDIRDYSMVRNPEEKNLSILQGEHYLTHSPVNWKGQGGLPYLTLSPPIMDILCNSPPHSWHELTQFSSEILRYVQICSALHLHERRVHFHIIICDVPFLFLFMSSDNIAGIVYQDTKDMSFHPKNMKQQIGICFQMFFELLPSILSISKASFNNSLALSLTIIFKLSSTTSFP